MTGTFTTSPGPDFGGALAAMLAAERPAVSPVGIAISPQAEDILRLEHDLLSRADMFFNALCGLPFIVDPRLSVDMIDVYYDRVAWDKRCAQQRMRDAERIPN
jgi:hypothetical protein